MTIKKLIIASALAGLTTFSYGQKLEIGNAAIAYKSIRSNPMWMMMDKDGKLKKDLYKAKEEIDKAYAKYEKENILKPKDETKMFFYRGMIYLDYMLSAATDSTMMPELKEHEKEYEEASFGSLKKCIETDTKKMYTKEIEAKLGALRGMALQGGVMLFQQENYQDAYNSFVSAVEMFEVIGQKDTLAMYNAALSADRLNHYDDAIKYYKECAELGYKPDVSYQSLIAVLNKKHGGPSDEAFQYIQEGKKKNPGSIALIIEELNYYLAKGESEKAQASLEEAIKKDPDNTVFLNNMGLTFSELAAKYHKEEKHDEAEVFAKKSIDAFEKTLAIDPNHADANFSLGLLYVSEAFELMNLITELKDEALYAKEKKRGNEYFEKSIVYLKKAHELNPKDVNTLKLLKSVYFNLDKTTEYEEVVAKLKALGQ